VEEGTTIPADNAVMQCVLEGDVGKRTAWEHCTAPNRRQRQRGCRGFGRTYLRCRRYEGLAETVVELLLAPPGG
jgi:hypothetical protein